MARPDQSVIPSTGNKELVEAVQKIADSVIAAQREIINAVQETRANLGAAAMFGTGDTRSRASALVRSTNWSTAADGLVLPTGTTPTRAEPEPLAAAPSGASNRRRTSGPSSSTPETADPEPLAAEPGRPRARKTRSDKGVPRGPRRKTEPEPTPVVGNEDLGQPLNIPDEVGPFTRETSEPVQRSFEIPSTFKQGKRVGHDKGGLRKLRDDAYASLARKLSEADFGGGRYEQVDVPESMQASPGDIVDHIPPAVPGEAMRKVWRNVRTLQVTDDATAQSGIRSLARADALRRGVSTMAGGGTLSEGVAAASATAGKVLGGAGVAVGVAQKGWETYREQIAANRPYQQVLGNSNQSVENYRERLRKTLFRVRSGLSMNPLSGGDADKLFEGAMDIYARDQGMRRRAEDVGTDLIRSTGMRAEEIISTFRVAARAGTESLKEIGTAFKEVTKEARSAGMNADEARKRFASTYEQISKSVTGVQGVMMAQAQTTALTAMGHRFTGVSLDNGMTADLFTSMLTGQSMGDVYAAKNSANGALVSEAAQQQRRTMAVNQLFGEGRINNLMAQFGVKPGDKLTPEMQQKMANELMRSVDFDPSVVVDALGGLGGMKGLDRNNAPLAAIQVMTGQVDTVGALEKQVGDLTQKTSPFSAEMRTMAGGFSKMDAYETDKAYRERYDYLTKTLGLNKGQAELAMKGATANGKIIQEGQAGAAARYMRQIEKTGQVDPIIEHLLKNYDNDRRYRVRTADGEKIVGNYELITNFADQARTGQVEITAGQNKGYTIAEMMGVDPTMLPGYGQTPASAEADYKGKTFKDSGEGITGTIIVKAAPDLQRWIDFQATGGGHVRTETYGVPSSGIVAPDMRPTGG